MKKILFSISIFISVFTFGQPGIGISYHFMSSAGISVFSAAGATNQAIPANNQDDFGYLFAPAGMSLKFGCKTYTKMIVSTNGWVALLPAAVAAIPASLSAGGYLNTNSLSTYNGIYPIFAPYWDDLSSTIISYNYDGTALWVRWTAKVDKTNSLGENLFWIRIDGNTGVIDYFYTSTPYTIQGTPSSSIGLAGVCTGDYYSYNLPLSPSYADSTVEADTISTLPLNITYTFTPYQLHDYCADAGDIGPMTSSCNFITCNINNACLSPGAPICSTAIVGDIWYRITKPAGILNVTVTTAATPAVCQNIIGTSIEVFDGCGGNSLGCSTTSILNPDYGELVLSRPSISEILYIRITSDNDIGGKFSLCVKGDSLSTAINDISSNENSVLIVFPNPANTKLTVHTQGKEKISVKNILGNEILFNNVFSDYYGNCELDISMLPSGIYIIKAGNITSKFIKN